MVMTVEQAQDSIFNLLKTRLSAPAVGIPATNIFEGSVPAGYMLPKIPGSSTLYPYFVVNFGGQSPVRGDYQGIASSKDDVKWTTVALEVVGGSQRDVRLATAEVRKILEGYAPDENWGELTEVLSGDYGVKVPDGDISPIRYATGIVFNGYTNAYRAELV